MSELCSLYINIQIKEEKLQRFFQEKPLPQNLDDDWRQWWESREMYGKQPLANIPHYQVQNNRAVFEEMRLRRDFVGMEQYDKKEECWTFVNVFFSENYNEIQPMLSLLK